MGAFLGVKGSRVQIPPSRPFPEQLFPELGTENGQLGTTMPLWPTIGWLPAEKRCAVERLSARASAGDEPAHR
jgi:hypothetical protein